MTLSSLFGMIGWALYCIIDALFINKRKLESLWKPEADWGPLLTENKLRATHLANLDHFRESESLRKRTDNNDNDLVGCGTKNNELD
jgi:hypothetical protein